ncbi:uncharacterized protein EURHEDRAFT_402666 [Aspergillus ruber CBS 135680]|uniref:Uncharacterized protein n=1 Tax=Aspergillus ruber (strain CBS 135680) TaxID=1388766 RepID=A0A017SEW4_ASPRC|nr:uncharacterized protein EURHEDRAFT_402666 [Aspergillus ruber CBS 135680]EYE95492.1 hypothetical protein EURHEDRAFT_402666 [Aspergillus ruber CBS 135680]
MPKQSQEQVLGIRNTLLTEELEKVVNKQMAHGPCQYDNNPPSYPDKIPNVYGRDMYLIEVPAFDFHRALAYCQRAVQELALKNKFFHDDQNQRQRNMWNVHYPIIDTERTTESTLLSISCQSSVNRLFIAHQSRKKQYLGCVNQESLEIITQMKRHVKR